MSEQEFIDALKKDDFILKQDQINQFNIYFNFLIEYNNHTNLTTIIEKEDVYLKHFYDSYLLTKTIDFNKINNCLDIGSGAGFPGIVLKILYPHIKITLLDSNNKKTKFLEELMKKLKITDVIIINDRAEKYIQERREYFDLVTARAVKNMQILTELSIPYVKVGGFFIAMKSEYKEELNNSLNGIKKLGGKVIETKEMNLPNNLGIRSFIIIQKETQTNIKYPREYNKILKHPL